MATTGSNAEFEEIVVRYLLGPWAPRLIELAELEPAERVLDLACCNGTIARLAAQWIGPSGSVVGVDPDDQALEFARSQTPPAGAEIAWTEAPAEELPFADSSFDVALCQQGLQFFGDRGQGLEEVRRVLTAGGRAVFSVWIERNPFDSAVYSAIEPFATAEQRELMARSIVIEDPEALRELFAAAGFRQIRILPRTMRLRYPLQEEFLLRRLALGGTRDAAAGLTDAQRQTVVRTAIEATRPFHDGSNIVVPSRSNLITARA